MESVRLAVPEDADACASLCARALEELSHARGGNLFARRETGLVAKALLRPGGLRRLMSDGRRLVVVEPGARGVGVGSRMLESVTAWLSAKGCKAVDAGALPGQRETKSFFESAGF